jgi:pimeloyl-ACP methyl ester carboxylesterase
MMSVCVRVHLLCAVLLCGCSPYAKVVEKSPRFVPAQGAHGMVVKAEQSVSAALDPKLRHRPVECIDCCLASTDAAAARLKSAPKDQAAVNVYNYALSRAFETLRKEKLNPWKDTMRVSGPEGEYIVTTRPLKQKWLHPSQFEYIPADQLDISGSYMTTRTVKPGLGAPLVAVGREEVKDAAKWYKMPRTFYGVTAVARFKGRQCEIAFEDPLGTEQVQLDGHAYPLAADFSAPLAINLATIRPRKLELLRLFNPQKYSDTARLARLEPYNPDKIPVLCVHGLMDSEATWDPLINTLRGDPEIRKNYQFWFFSYPSGYPYPLSASMLRRQMDGLSAVFPGHKKIVLIGHSMGGCISRLLITDSGDTLWRSTFDKSPAETKLNSSAQQKIEDALIFRHRDDVSRVIFISAPLRGSDLAQNWLGRLASKLIKSPLSLLGIPSEALHMMVPRSGNLAIKSVPNSVDTLSPNNRFVKAVNTIPITPGIPYHSIIGDRGKGDTPNSSDGVVPYWSSHLAGAQSEKIVPSSHSAQQNPEAIAEVSRILKVHAKQQSKSR